MGKFTNYQLIHPLMFILMELFGDVYYSSEFPYTSLGCPVLAIGVVEEFGF
jgi:hypothetical protein